MGMGRFVERGETAGERVVAESGLECAEPIPRGAGFMIEQKRVGVGVDLEAQEPVAIGPGTGAIEGRAEAVDEIDFADQGAAFARAGFPDDGFDEGEEADGFSAGAAWTDGGVAAEALAEVNGLADVEDSGLRVVWHAAVHEIDAGGGRDCAKECGVETGMQSPGRLQQPELCLPLIRVRFGVGIRLRRAGVCGRGGVVGREVWERHRMINANCGGWRCGSHRAKAIGNC